MTTREKRLLGLLCIVAVAAGIDRLWGLSGRIIGPSPAAQRLEEAQKASSGMAATIAGLPLREGDVHALTLALRPLAENPFQAALPPARKEGGKLAKNGAEGTVLQYTGYVALDGNAMAIINGMEYAAGDTVPETGDVVRRIGESEVVLFSPSRNAEWALSYSGDDL